MKTPGLTSLSTGVGGALFIAFAPVVFSGYSAALLMILGGALLALGAWLGIRRWSIGWPHKRRVTALAILALLLASTVAAGSFLALEHASDPNSPVVAAHGDETSPLVLPPTTGGAGRYEQDAAVLQPQQVEKVQQSPPAELGGTLSAPVSAVALADSTQTLDASFRRQLIEQQAATFDDRASRLYNDLTRYSSDVSTYTMRAEMEKWERDVKAFLARHYVPGAQSHFADYSRRYAESYPEVEWRNREAVAVRSSALNRMREKRERLAEALQMGMTEERVAQGLQ